MSKLTDYGTMVLASWPPATRGCRQRARLRSHELGQPTVSKLLKALVHAGLVVSTRGVQGGYALARPAAAISAAEIIDALEGPVAITECSSGRRLRPRVVLPGRDGVAADQPSIRQALEGVTLADLQHRRQPLPQPDLRAGLRERGRARANCIRDNAWRRIQRTSTTSSSASTGTASSRTSSRTPCRPGLERGRHPADLREEGRAASS